MSDAQTRQEKSAKQMRTYGWVIAVYLIGNFLFRALVTANEYPSRLSQAIEITFDVLGVVGLFAVKKYIPPMVFIAAVIAGIALLGIRLHSDASWWTGHWNYSVR
jgi:hypothetical protein